MKNTFFLFLLLCSFTLSLKAQNIENYIRYRGKNIANAAHITNDFVRGYYNSSNRNYTDLTIITKDNLLGRDINTRLRLIHGFANLYFKDIVVLNDNDITDPFDAFGIQASFFTELYKMVDKETYDKMRYEIRNTFNTDFKNWTGKMWALLALNLDYYDFLMQ